MLLARMAAAEPPAVTVSVGGPTDDPAYLPVHAAAALGTFAAEGIEVTLKRAKHPTAAVAALREREAGIAVATLDEGIRGGWSRKLPLQVIVAHVRAPTVALLVAPGARDTIRRVEDLRGKPVGMPGPGTTGHLLLAALLRGARIEPSKVDVRSVVAPALLTQFASGDLGAAMVEEPWVSRLLEAERASALIDLRQPAEIERLFGGPFYEVVSLAAAPVKEVPKAKPRTSLTAPKEPPPPIQPPPDAVLAAYARALARVQVWLATTPPQEIAERLPANLVGDRARFAARIGPRQAAYAGSGEATAVGLTATLRVLRGGGSPWPATLSLGPDDLVSPPAVAEARGQLGPAPPAP
jgi:NitT/TauT family transport system substrate-binding protein